MSQILSPQLIEGLQRFDSATVANAIEHFEVRDPTMGYANNELVCQMPEIATPMVGYAVTVTADTTTPGDSRSSRVDDLVEAIDAAPKPSVLVVQHVGHDRKRCCLFGICSARLHISWDAWGLLPMPTVVIEVLSANAHRISMYFRLDGLSHTVMGYTSISM